MRRHLTKCDYANCRHCKCRFAESHVVNFEDECTYNLIETYILKGLYTRISIVFVDGISKRVHGP